jgi:nitroreductase
VKHLLAAAAVTAPLKSVGLLEVGVEQSRWQELALSLVAWAVRAPSSHNTQPWVFRITGSAIDLLADRTRALPVNDPDDRELTISCGCALMNLRVAAADRGAPVDVQLLPEPGDRDLLARLSHAAQPGPAAGEAELAGEVGRRHTFRKPFASRDLESSVPRELRETAEREGVRLQTLVADDQRRRVVELVAAGDKAQWENPSWRRELAAWMHPRRRGDGLAVPALAAPAAKIAVRAFDMGEWVAGRDQKLAKASPLLVALSTTDDAPRDWMRAGQALQRVLLVARRHRLQACYLNQPIQVASLRPELQELLGGGFPQLLIGLGHPGEEIKATPRRPVTDVIE